MARGRAKGRITTFFSYKGGVGRTMAVANVAFIAALAGKRVLVMDWDLEAPGLPVYFRGITEPAAASQIRRSKGVLNLFVDWRDKMACATSGKDVQDIVRHYRSGKPFEECICPLLPEGRLPKGAKLDIIGAGANVIGDSEPVPYAEALSRFQWSDFFELCAGGAMLTSLQTWCKQKYDYILLDSRTGLADVAGICTMQLPDEVVLCFILNLQNTEGVADIARSIRNSRGDEISIRVSPMRVSKDRPTEESDARSRAQRALRRAGLEATLVESDMTQLSIAAASNIPFYETLAPFAASSMTADPLTFEYLKMTQQLCGADFAMPRLDQAWVDDVRRRLQPRMATVEYLAALEGADPDRAIDELNRFLDGAIDADPRRELDPEYAQALVNTAFEANDWFWDDHDEATRGLGEKALLLLRHLHAFDDADWRLALIDAYDEFDSRWESTTSYVERVKARDALLADGPQTDDIVLRRVSLRIQNARQINARSGTANQINRQLAQAEELLEQIPLPRPSSTIEDMALKYAEIAALRGQRAMARRHDEAREQWRLVIRLTSGTSAGRAAVLRAEAHAAIATLIANDDPDEAAKEIIAAVEVWPGVTRNIDQFAKALAIISRASDREQHAAAFARMVLGRPGEHRMMVGAGARAVGATARFLLLLDQLATMVAGSGRGRREALGNIGNAAEHQLQRVMRVHRDRLGDSANMARLLTACQTLFETLAAGGASPATLDRHKISIDRVRALLRQADK